MCGGHHPVGQRLKSLAGTHHRKHSIPCGTSERRWSHRELWSCSQVLGVIVLWEVGIFGGLWGFCVVWRDNQILSNPICHISEPWYLWVWGCRQPRYASDHYKNNGYIYIYTWFGMCNEGLPACSNYGSCITGMCSVVAVISDRHVACHDSVEKNKKRQEDTRLHNLALTVLMKTK